MTSARLRHVPALDGVRGAAVAAVLLFHGGQLRGGYLGVDLFFVLSGFLITTLLLREAEREAQVDIVAFWAKRARRLLPALFLVLLAVALYAAFVAAPDELGRIRGDELATLAYVANWRFVVRGFDYWALFSQPSPLAHTWSLSIEEQFYLLWPLLIGALLWFVGRRGRDRGTAIRRPLLVICATGALLSAGWMLWITRTGTGTTRAYYGTDTRVQSILVGALLAAVFVSFGPVRGTRARLVLESAALVGIGVLAVAWARLGGDSTVLYHGGLLVCAIAGAVVIWAAVQPEPRLVARLLSVRPLVALGIISYGVYLWHWPIFVWLDGARVGLTGWPLLGVRVIATLGVAILSFVLVERPIRSGALSPTTLRWLTPVAAAALVAVALVGTSAASVPVAASARASVVSATAEARRHVGGTRLLVVGNSVATMLARDGLNRVKARPHLSVLDVSTVACVFPPTPKVQIPSEPAGVALPDCRHDWVDAVAHFRPDVVLAAYNDVGTFGFLRHGAWVRPCSTEFARWYLAELRRATATLGAGGARVVLTTSAYQLGDLDTPEVRRQAACENDLTRSYVKAHPDLTLVDIGAFVCPSRDGVPILVARSRAPA